MGLSRLVKIKHLVNHRKTFALLHHGPDVLFEFSRHLRLVGHAARAQGGAGECETLDHQAYPVNLGFRRLQKCNLHQPTVNRQGLEIALHIVAADHVQNDVHALLRGCCQGFIDKVLGPVIDSHIRTGFQTSLNFVCVADGTQNTRAKSLGQLNRRQAYAGRSAVHQECFARLHTTALKHIRPDGEIVFRQRGGLQQAQTFGHRQNLALRYGHVLGIRAAVGQAADCIANAPLRHTFTHGNHTA